MKERTMKPWEECGVWRDEAHYNAWLREDMRRELRDPKTWLMFAIVVAYLAFAAAPVIILALL